MKGRTFQRAKLTTVEVAEIKLLLDSSKHNHKHSPPGTAPYPSSTTTPTRTGSTTVFPSQLPKDDLIHAGQHLTCVYICHAGAIHGQVRGRTVPEGVEREVL
jgi:hypothetical protein